jgi:hypothetical protein
MFYVAEDLKYIDQTKAHELRDKCFSISQKISAFIKYLQNNEKPKQK